MNTIFKTATLTIIAASTALTGCGGVNKGFVKDVRPSDYPYYFIAKHEDLGAHTGVMYPVQGHVQTAKVYQAHIGQPSDNHVICFDQNTQAWQIPIKDQKGIEQSLHFMEGVYPFQIFEAKKIGSSVNLNCSAYYKDRKYTGAIAFYNYNDDIEFATFGRNKETELISPDVLAKADAGLLGFHTITFDGLPRISYWVGNRTDAYKSGAPTVELDFSAVNLKEVRVNGKLATNGKAVLPVFKPYNGLPVLEKEKHKIYMRTHDGVEYEGYIKDLDSNEFTAFMKIPCDLPKSLFEAASKGTVAKFDITSKNSNGNESKLGQILFGLKR